MYKQSRKFEDYHIGETCWYVKVDSDILYDFCLWKVRIVKPHLKWNHNFECVIREVLIGQVVHDLGYQTIDYTWLSKTLDEAIEELVGRVKRPLIIKSIFRNK